MNPDSGTQPIAELVDIHKSFGKNTVLRGISARFHHGQTSCIVGRSGSGKSTLLRTLNLLEVPDSGRVLFDQKEVTIDKKVLQKHRSQIGFVFQNFNLFANLSAIDNVAFGLQHVHGQNKEAARATARKHLDSLGLARFAEYKPSRMSGGQQQRVAIARVLAAEPRLLLFDEATSALDPERVKEVLSVMKDLASQGMSMVVVTHEMGFAREAADELIFIDGGRIVEFGEPDLLLDDPSHPQLKQFLSKVL